MLFSSRPGDAPSKHRNTYPNKTLSNGTPMDWTGMPKCFVGDEVGRMELEL